MAGAATLASLGALRSGAGLVSCLHLSAERPPGLPPEVMTSPALEPTATGIGSLVVGPGLGTSDRARGVLMELLEEERPRVFDADALNLMAHMTPRPLVSGAVLTPHPLEAARLLGCDAREVQKDRPGAIRQLATTWNAIVLLKGAGTLLAGPSGPGYLLDTPEPTLAIPGSGDVLAGLTGGLQAQGLPALHAAVLAAAVHLDVGRRFGRDSDQRGALASELAAAFPSAMEGLRRLWVRAPV
ncbi:MAG: ADP/ATP-dependent (S)-NAD(P)H-hydrate dehydratase [Myxococcota bacterium]|nr:ADP/ATP-dependent (S)-NAD(P)H-hydrate dehydratase [Myxococcota bacterium]